jgi:hypothetical protein
MDDRLLLEVLGITKLNKLTVISVIEKEYSKTHASVEYEKSFAEMELYSKTLTEQMEEKSHYFSRKFKSEKEMTDTFDKFFLEIHNDLEKIIKLFITFKSTYTSEVDLPAHMLITLTLKDVLTAYVFFLDKFEASLMGLTKDKVVLALNPAEQIELMLYLQENQKGSLFMPLLVVLGVGYFLVS